MLFKISLEEVCSPPEENTVTLVLKEKTERYLKLETDVSNEHGLQDNKEGNQEL